MTDDLGRPRKRRRAPPARRKTVRWSTREVEALLAGVREHGVGKWAAILRQSPVFNGVRTSVDLKDKWRNLTSPMRAAALTPGSPRITSDATAPTAATLTSTEHPAASPSESSVSPEVGNDPPVCPHPPPEPPASARPASPQCSPQLSPTATPMATPVMQGPPIRTPIVRGPPPAAPAPTPVPIGLTASGALAGLSSTTTPPVGSAAATTPPATTTPAQMAAFHAALGQSLYQSAAIAHMWRRMATSPSYALLSGGSGAAVEDDDDDDDDDEDTVSTPMLHPGLGYPFLGMFTPNTAHKGGVVTPAMGEPVTPPSAAGLGQHGLPVPSADLRYLTAAAMAGMTHSGLGVGIHHGAVATGATAGTFGTTNIKTEDVAVHTREGEVKEEAGMIDDGEEFDSERVYNEEPREDSGFEMSGEDEIREDAKVDGEQDGDESKGQEVALSNGEDTGEHGLHGEVSIDLCQQPELMMGMLAAGPDATDCLQEPLKLVEVDNDEGGSGVIGLEVDDNNFPAVHFDVG